MEKNILWPGWETVRMIGQGSFGAVYEIQRDVFGDIEKAALKVIAIPQNASDIDEMYSDGYDDESITSAFQSHLESIVAEYSLMRKMNGCANVVNCDDMRYVQHDDGFGWDIYIKMELLTPLIKALPSETSEGTVVKIAKDMCNALIACKEYNIVHRDIKPQNIFISKYGDYKLGDFGIAKTVEKTMGGTKIGTYKYMAPEVYNNQRYGAAADIYSLGLVLYWLLNERRMPFLPLPPEKLKAGMEEQARQLRFSGEPLPPPAHGSEALKTIVLKACAYNSKERYASAANMLEDLNQLDGGAAVIPPVISDSTVAGQAAVTQIPGPTAVGVKETAEEQTSSEGYNVIAAPPAVAKSEKKIEVEQHSAKEQTQGTGKKSSAGKFWATVLGVIAVIIIALLLKCCGGVKPEDRPFAGLSGNSNTPMEQLEWSEWTDQLPGYVTDTDYDIEEKTVYSSRTLETASSTEKSDMPGWELFDTVEADGDFGLWSDWSAAKVNASATREVETQLRYRYRDKETTTGSNSKMSGWELYDTTHTWGDYGNWSSWSSSAVSKSNSRDVETKTQYRYRTKNYTTSSSASLSGWTRYDYSTSYGSWGSWSGWSNSYVESSDLRQVETRYIEPTYRTEYNYSRYNEYNYASTGRRGWNGPTKGYWGGHYCQYYEERGWSTDRLSCDRVDSGYGVYGGNWYNEQSRQVEVTSGYTQYRYRDRSRSTTYYYYQWSGWSDYSDSYVSSNSDREVSTRTRYRYRDRESIPTYHFWKWGNWSDWSANEVSATNDRQVEETTYYRYRDQVNATTYYFKRWTDWTAYTDSAVVPSDTVEVQTKTQYRYKYKGN